MSRSGLRFSRRSTLVGALLLMAAIGTIVATAFDHLGPRNINIGESLRAVEPAILRGDTAASAPTAAAASVPAASAVSASEGSAAAASAAQAAQNADERRNTAVIDSLAKHRPPAHGAGQAGAPLRERHAGRQHANSSAVYGHH